METLPTPHRTADSTEPKSPAAEAEPPPFFPPLRPLRWGDPFRWLAAGWADFRRAPGIGITFGCLFMGMGWLLLAVFRHAPAYALALSAGFLLLGPFLCLGLYQVSRDLEQGRVPDLGDALTCWSDHLGQMALFGGALLILEMIWARASLVVFAVAFDDGAPAWDGSLAALLAPQNLPFVATYVVVGALFAALIFAFSVIAIPMLLDRQADAISAALTSARLVFTQTGVMLLWALLVAGLVGLALLPGFAGLLLIAPVIGHASWHAYRAAVAPRAPPEGAASVTE